MRVGIYPGAFDPVHKGHIAFALAAITAHQLDKVFFLPEPSPRHKQGVKALDHRVEMVRLATANDPRIGDDSTGTNEIYNFGNLATARRTLYWGRSVHADRQ